MPGGRVNCGHLGGYIKITNDDRENLCFVCHEPYEVRFIQFASPERGRVLFLRVCSSCLDALATEHEALRLDDSPQPKDVSNVPRPGR